MTSGDILTHDFDGNALDNKDGARLYGERFIHGEIYRARPEVMSVVHCHAPQLIPFGATRTALKPLYHMSGFLAEGVPIFEIREAAGMTDMLIRTSALGAALARSLGDKPMVLMRGHGATMVGPLDRAGGLSLDLCGAQRRPADGGDAARRARLSRSRGGPARDAVNDGAIDRPWELWRAEAMGDA